MESNWTARAKKKICFKKPCKRPREFLRIGREGCFPDGGIEYYWLFTYLARDAWLFAPSLNSGVLWILHFYTRYEYSRTHDRLWRKTRSRHSGSKSCVGVDPNRNWGKSNDKMRDMYVVKQTQALMSIITSGYHWGELGASTRTCSDTFRGLKPFSELNTRAISDFIMKLKTQTDLQVSVY